MRAALLVLVVSGCGAQMARNPNAPPPQYAPVNESRAGEVSYSANGAAFVVRSRREDAYKQMYHACRGYYRIDSEEGVVTGHAVESDGSGSAYTHPQITQVIRFSCVAPMVAR